MNLNCLHGLRFKLTALLVVALFGLVATPNSAYALCVQPDEEDSWPSLWHMAQALDRQGIACYPEWSRRGGHLWMFTSRQPGQAIRRFGQGLAEEYRKD